MPSRKSSLRNQAHPLGQNSPRHPALPQAQHRQAPLSAHGVVGPLEPGTRRRLTNIGASNGLLRQYFPKATDLAVHTAERLALVQDELNARPRKRHQWATPAQRLTALQSPHG